MALTKYKILYAECVGGAVSIPEKAEKIGLLVDAGTGVWSVVFLMTFPDWAEEFPDEAAREAAGLAGAQEEQNAGAENVK